MAYLSSFGIGVFILKMNLKEFPSLLFFGRVCEGLVLILIWIFIRIHQWNWLILLVKRFLTADLISLLVISLCSDFVFHHDSVLINCMFLEIYPFLIGCQICWHVIVHNISYDPLYFSCISCNISFISDIESSLFGESS